MTRRSKALATSVVVPLLATITSGQRRRSRHENIRHFHTTRLCVSWATPQESGRNLATSRVNRVFPPEKISARDTNSGWKSAESFRKPANPTVALYLAVIRSRAPPPRVSSSAPHLDACHDRSAGAWPARGRRQNVTRTSTTVSTRSARCAINGRPGRRQGVDLAESGTLGCSRAQGWRGCEPIHGRLVDGLRQRGGREAVAS